MPNVVAQIEAFLLNPLAAVALALVFVVIGWKYDVNASSWFLAAAWALRELPEL